LHPPHSHSFPTRRSSDLYGMLHLVDHGRLDGWFPRFMVGHQAYLFYGPGFSWLLALVRLPTLGALSTTGAMKVLTVASFVTLGPDRKSTRLNSSHVSISY